MSQDFDYESFWSSCEEDLKIEWILPINFYEWKYSKYDQKVDCIKRRESAFKRVSALISEELWKKLEAFQDAADQCEDIAYALRAKMRMKLYPQKPALFIDLETDLFLLEEHLLTAWKNVAEGAQKVVIYSPKRSSTIYILIKYKLGENPYGKII